MMNNKIQQSKFNAIWLSHSSVSDFLKCPRLYFLKNIWKNKSGRKVNTVSPHLSLGSSVHQTIEPLALLKVEDRLQKFEKDILGEYELMKIFYKNWKKFEGIMGGFESKEEEEGFKKRGEEMIKNVLENKGPLANRTVKFYSGDFIPNIYLDEKENIILCGLVDWVEYIEKDDSLRVIDFKTGKNEEKEDSFQLPIYKILVESLQKRKVSGGAYWYLDRDKFPTSKEIPDEDIEMIKGELLKIGLQIKELKASKPDESKFKCKYKDKETGQECYACREFELIKDFDENGNNHDGKVKYLGIGEYKQDLYFVKK